MRPPFEEQLVCDDPDCVVIHTIGVVTLEEDLWGFVGQRSSGLVVVFFGVAVG